MEKHCIVNGDDFGASPGISRGILEAHQKGILTSTSLMVDMPDAQQAARLSRDFPRLSVGLHAVFTHEDCSPRIDFNDTARCRHELERQWNRFCELVGRPPTHLDAHHNIYRDARLTPLFIECAAANYVPLREHSQVNYFPDFYGQWDGDPHLEQISVDNLCRMLAKHVGPGITELGCHPGHIDEGFKSSYSIERETELRTLCSPIVRQAIGDLGIALVSYHELGNIAFGTKARSAV